MLVFIVCGYLHRCNRKFTKLFNCWLVVFVLMLLILLVLSLSARQDQTCLWLGRAEYDISLFKQFAAVLTLLFCSLSWCNYFFSWCNCCFAYFVAELVMRANQAVCLAILHWFSLVTKAVLASLKWMQWEIKQIIIPCICNHHAVSLSYQ